jgi:hypothetical protein
VPICWSVIRMPWLAQCDDRRDVLNASHRDEWIDPSLQPTAAGQDPTGLANIPLLFRPCMRTNICHNSMLHSPRIELTILRRKLSLMCLERNLACLLHQGEKAWRLRSFSLVSLRSTCWKRQIELHSFHYV